jgi:hypothetical protein
MRLKAAILKGGLREVVFGTAVSHHPASPSPPDSTGNNPKRYDRNNAN